MTTPMSDEDLDALRKRLQWQQRVHGNQAAHEANLAIEALIAERDAAVAANARLQIQLPNNNADTIRRCAQALAEWEAALERIGERRANAAIVADLKALRHHEAYYRISLELDNLATRYERGDHITEAKP